jgi:hypothetical protein
LDETTRASTSRKPVISSDSYLSTPEHAIPASRQNKTYRDITRPRRTPQNTPHGAEGNRTDPDLEKVVEAWPDLPAAVKAGIVAMVRAAGNA